MDKIAFPPLACLLAVAFAGCLENGPGAPFAAAPDAPGLANATLSSLDWSLDIDGDFAASFTVHPNTRDTADCRFVLDYQDSTQASHWSAFVAGDRMPHRSWVVTGGRWHVAHVHATDQVDTRPYIPMVGGEQRIKVALEAAGLPAGARYSFAVLGLKAQGSATEPSLVLRAACDDSTLQNVSAGRTVTLFDASTFKSGLSASLSAPGAGAAVSVLEPVAAHVQEEAGRVFLAGLDLVAARAEVEHPSGTTPFEAAPSIDGTLPFLSVDDHAGDYRVTVTQAALENDDLWGAIFGLDPFTDLDALRPSPPHGHDCGSASVRETCAKGSA